MSWWNSSNLTSFASQALKTAQKRIDKVLDISEEGGSPDASIPTPKQNVDAPKSPDSTKNEPDGDNFWSAWLGDGSEKKEKKEEETTSEIVDTSLTKIVTSGFKSERAKSKVEEAIMSTSTKSLQVQKQEKSEETDATITTSTVTTVTTEKIVSSTSGKKSSPLKLTSRLAKKKSEKPEKAKEDKRSSDEDGDIQGLLGVSEKCEAPGDSQDSNLGQDDADSSDIKLKGSTGESQIEAQDTALAITDMVSSVSDGWTVEGWAADGQLEDLLQTSLMQQMEEEEGVKASGGEQGMTRSLSSSSAVTVQDLEPSLVVVVDSEEVKKKTEVTSEVITEVITEVMTDVTTDVTTEDQAVSEPEKSSEIAQTETANQAENTVSVPSENDTDDMKDVATEETAANLLVPESSESADLPHDDAKHTEESESNELATDAGPADAGISQDAIQEAHIKDELVADTSAPNSEEMVADKSETSVSREPAEEVSPDADVEVESCESNEEVKYVSNGDVED